MFRDKTNILEANSTVTCKKVLRDFWQTQTIQISNNILIFIFRAAIQAAERQTKILQAEIFTDQCREKAQALRATAEDLDRQATGNFTLLKDWKRTTAQWKFSQGFVVVKTLADKMILEISYHFLTWFPSFYNPIDFI